MGRTISTRSPSRSATEAYDAFGVISRFTATAVNSRLTARCVRRASTLSPSATSISRPLTVIFIETKTAAPPVEGAAASVRAVFPSPALPGSGSRGPGPHPVLRIPPPTTTGGSIHPRFALFHLRRLAHQGIALRVVDGINSEIDVELGPIEMIRARALHGRDRRNAGLAEPRELLERDEGLLRSDHEPKSLS